MIFRYFSKGLQRRWKVVSFIITIIVGVAMFYYAEKVRYPLCLKRTEKYRAIDFQGVVSDKYTEFNHGKKVINIQSSDAVKFYRQTDHSGFYEFVQIGDSVTKKGGSLDVYVYRDSSKYKFTIDFKCEDL
jgi:hypothetical protein